MIKIQLCSLILLSTMVNGVRAQMQKDAKALEILDSMCAYCQNIKACEVTFTYTIENLQEGEQEEFEGTITVKGEKYRLCVEGQEIFSNGETTWLYLKDVNEVNINNYDPKDHSNPFKIYTIYKEGYQSMYVEEKVIKGKIYDIIELTPIEQDDTIFKIALEIERDTKRLRSWSKLEHNGTKHTYLITKFEEKLSLDDTYFNFNPDNYEGIEVIDMR